LANVKIANDSATFV